MEKEIYEILLKMAKKAAIEGEMPCSALILDENNKIVSKAYNTRNKRNITIDHAEIKAILKANKKLKSWRLNNCTLYVLLEPCDMCKNVIKESRIKETYYYLPRLSTKKIYDRGKITNIKDINIENYKNILKEFWQKRR